MCLASVDVPSDQLSNGLIAYKVVRKIAEGVYEPYHRPNTVKYKLGKRTSRERPIKGYHNFTYNVNLGIHCYTGLLSALNILVVCARYQQGHSVIIEVKCGTTISSGWTWNGQATQDRTVVTKSVKVIREISKAQAYEILRGKDAQRPSIR